MRETGLPWLLKNLGNPVFDFLPSPFPSPEGERDEVR
jgi:hypothetical protein